jgi:hypothetical protein
VALMLGTARCQGRRRVVVGCAEGPGDAAGQDGEHKGGHGAAAVDDSTGPRYGRPPSRVKRGRARQRPTADLSSSQVTARAPGRHARAGDGMPGQGAKNCRRGLWTTACWRCGSLVSVSRVAPTCPQPDDINAPIAVARVHRAAAQVRVGQNRTDRGNLCTQAVDDRVDGDRGAVPGPGSDGPARCSVRSHRRPDPGQ